MSCRRGRCWIVRCIASLLVSTAVAMACGDAPVADDLKADQIVYVRPGRSGNDLAIAASSGSGVLHIDAECIVLEVIETDWTAGFYTVLFSLGGHVSVSSPTGPLILRDRPPGATDPNDSEGVEDAYEMTIADGDEVVFAAPNAWKLEHFDEGLIAFVTLPHQSCPQQFWLPGYRDLHSAEDR